MKRRAFIRSLVTLAVFAAFVFPAALHAQPATGVIEGRVFNAATSSALANARVTLEGTNREVITDEAGSYRLPGVPAGEARLNEIGRASCRERVWYYV